MNKNILFCLIILGVFFVGSATYALFNENLLLDAVSDIQSNDTALSNNQPNIQNNQPSNIVVEENSNLIPLANTILKDIGIVNGDVGQKVVKEVSRFTVNNVTYAEFDDSSFIFIRDNITYNAKNSLIKIYDVDSVSGGYLDCYNCGKFIPVGAVSQSVPEDYLCDCGAFIIGKNVPWIYSEENVLEYIKYTEDYYNDVGIPEGNPFGHVQHIDSVASDNVSVSDEATQESTENTDSQGMDYSKFDLIEVSPQKPQTMSGECLQPIECVEISS